MMTPSTVVFLLGVLALVVAMVCRKNVVVPAIVATFLTALFYNGDVVQATMAVFRASIQAGTALFDLFVVIACITAMIAAMRNIGSDVLMTVPFTKIMLNGPTAYIVLFAVTYPLSLVFWPTPALALVAALLLPAAVKAGLPPLASGIAIALAGQGMAIASDYVIGMGPAIMASGSAELAAESVAISSLLISWVIGAVAFVLAYVLVVRKLIRKARIAPELRVFETVSAGSMDGGSSGAGGGSSGEAPSGGSAEHGALPRQYSRLAKIWAVGVPIAFVLVLVYMLLGRFTDLVPWDDGAGAAFVGGAAVVLMILVLVTSQRKVALEDGSTHLIDGLSYAFKAMGVVVPIGGFFYLGIPDYSGAILGLPEEVPPPQFLFDTVAAIQPYIPANAFIGAFAIVLIGMLISLDGSGWAGLPLVGGISVQIADHVGIDATLLAALGQNAAVWTGGGTLLTWSSLIAVAAFARVPVVDLVRSMFIPVVSGFAVAAVVVAVIG
ncbi:hypothetical protein [Arthrobacter sulfonylureivorans]|uniref:Permease n=1 Tax=Arthrobacter sulfonylureivorans TaxID=2486855 RepID=A0ABY3WBX8_9MICC|nr:hypothetical protein [Arthrobacter sulfonylureivorans]UNK47875.1 hypothetical protein MNQ99_18560 [Arthrobacter sulfonylureivorans]